MIWVVIRDDAGQRDIVPFSVCNRNFLHLGGFRIRSVICSGHELWKSLKQQGPTSWTMVCLAVGTSVAQSHNHLMSQYNMPKHHLDLYPAG